MYSEYGSSFTGWVQQERTRPKSLHLDNKSASYIDLIQQRKLEEVRREFQLNGFDSPYNPDDDVWQPRESPGSGAVYLRQKSWPAPDSSPAVRLPRPRSLAHNNFATSTPIFDDVPPFVPEWSSSTSPEPAGRETVSAEQARVLSSLPDGVLYELLRELKKERRYKPSVECRFCRNNGERASFCATHALRDAAGRVSCPVLRAFTCPRCGASGDRAHTIKYCPSATSEERNLSHGMMRSMRKSCARRRYPPAAPPVAPPLEPGWAALEQKLLHFQLDGAHTNHLNRYNCV